MVFKTQGKVELMRDRKRQIFFFLILKLGIEIVRREEDIPADITV